MSMRDDILAEIEKFLNRTGMSPTRFGEKTMNDRALVMRLRDGRDLKLSTAEKLRAFMRNYVPEDKPRQKKAA